MPRSRSVLVLLVALALSVSFAVPIENDPGTPYDESESLPYEGSPAVSVAPPEDGSGMPAVRLRLFRLRRGCLRRAGAQHLEHGRGCNLNSPVPFASHKHVACEGRTSRRGG